MNEITQPATAGHYHIDADSYERMYAESVQDPEAFWGEHGKRLDWIKPYSRVKNTSFDYDNVSIKWYEDGTLNVAANCVDRHLATRGDRTAIIWEPDEPTDEALHISYSELHAQVGKMANVLKSLGVEKGDRVVIYLPMIPEAAYAMLACARIGAIHSIVFAGFSPDALGARINGCDAKVVITADHAPRGGRKTKLKDNVNQALLHDTDDVKCLVVQRTGDQVAWRNGLDFWWHEEAEKVSANCAPEEMNAEDPLFILYTSGSTGMPKGVVHTTGGYLTYASMTHEYIFDYHEGDIYWCTADVGWVTGHSYIVYGPLANGATTLMFEGVPTYPDAGRFWQVCEQHGVQHFYTAPTAIRSLMRLGEEPVRRHERSTLITLGTVGEPINPEAWEWYYRVVGDRRCPILDTWWQTETGGILMAPVPGLEPLKPGAAMRALPGIEPELIDGEGHVVEGEGSGNLVLATSWPGQMRTVYGDHQRFVRTYFSTHAGRYFTGDGAHRDADSHWWITGRVDDVLNVSGHRMGTAEVESALVGHPAVAEAAVVGMPHETKGQGIYAYVTPMAGVEPDDELRQGLISEVREQIGPIATPDVIHWAPALPKTRSGKIMRRILRKVAAGETDQLGDTSTLAEPEVVADLITESERLRGAS